MKASINIFVLMTATLTACYYDDPAPYVIFKDTYAEVIYDDTLFVDLNSKQELLVEAGSDASNVRYLKQKNNEEVVDITGTELVQYSTTGWNGHNNYENSIVYSSFPDSLYVVGDVLRITVRFNSNGWYGKTLFYKVKE
ncbi:hypothetical protein [Imperialibacter roseus]|uniref:Lipoprotein n=1 Tax=Imperialibacter roseus TaxID=1324217 RepID=A0ABZ0IUT5_9BACT|nr:hypothetical protein [Imperialibacter roseus]WOK08807.1 hypothetical protein RT717_09185 [Imperialibacter roseus]|tara:strand:- start:26056 stop:26472 length:417 start_codon:yes stop_codon:yes gene_type:complete